MFSRPLFLLFTLYIGISHLYSSELDKLLEDYRHQSELSLKTKKESAGHLIIFTRDDLERMQAYRLSDLLKSIRMFTLQENQIGFATLARAGSTSFNSSLLRIYINDHDIGSPFFGSAFGSWSDIDLGYIDHVEIYTGGVSTQFGNEPAGILIKLYTKDPLRENGGRVKYITGKNGSGELNLYYGGIEKEQSYFIYANNRTENKDPIYHGDSTISRDYDSDNLYASLYMDDATVEIARFTKKSDGFIGIGTRGTPQKNDKNSRHEYISLTNHFQEGTLKSVVSYDNIFLDHYEYDTNDSGGGEINVFLPDGSTQTVSEFAKTRHENIFSALVEKQFKTPKSETLVGAQYKHKHYYMSTITLDGVENKDRLDAPATQIVNSIFIESSYNFTDNLLLLGSYKYDKYLRDNGQEDLNEQIYRLAFISLFGEHTTLKLTGTHSYSPPAFMQSNYFPTFFKQNSQLKPERYKMYIADLTYRDTDYRLSLTLCDMLGNDLMMRANQNGSLVFINYPEEVRSNGYRIGAVYFFDNNNKIEADFYQGQTNMETIYSSLSGGYIRLFNKLGNTDIFNEVIYRSGYDYPAPSGDIEVEDGYDYTAGMIYHINPDTSFSVKGENIFDSAINTPYQKISQNIPAVERNIRFSVEYLF